MTGSRMAAAWFVWVVGLAGYIAAIVNRSSFSTLGTVAQQHFGIEATVLATFLVVQIAVYAAMQIPVGVLLDRFGATRVICAGLVIMAAGQLLMAFAPHVTLGFLARVLVGIGDACMFISLLRLVADWFPQRVLPVISQMTGLIGQVGQFISVVPLAILVTNAGWQAGFVALTAVSFGLFVISFATLRDSRTERTLLERLIGRGKHNTAATARSTTDTAALWDSPIGHISPPTEAIPVVGPGGSGVFGALKMLLRRPGMRLGFWVHFGTASGFHCFLLLWGSAFLMGGEGLDRGQAASVLSTTIVSSMLGGIVLGPIQARFKRWRIVIVVSYLALLGCLWGAVLLWPATQAPLPLLHFTAFVIGLGAPMSMIGFDVARTHVHRNQIGVATGIVNTGSFSATLIMIFGIGLLLDLQGAGSPDTYTAEAFRVAMSWQYVIWALCLVMIAVEFPKAKRALLKRRRVALSSDIEDV